MSRWTHIRGGLELYSTPFETKKDEEGQDVYYLPFPEEQMKVRFDGMRYRYDRGEELPIGLSFAATIYSMPRAKKYIDEAFAMLPQGEIGFRYAIKQDANDYSSSQTYFGNPSVENAFYEAVEKFMSKGARAQFDVVDKEELIDECGLELSMADYASALAIGVRNDLRDCSGWELMESLEKALNHLKANHIGVEDGYLEWQDEYEPKWIYAWRCSCLQPEECSFMILDAKTNSVLWKKTFSKPCDEEGLIIYDSEDLIESIEGKLPWE